MRQIREILRQKWVVGASHRDVAGSLGVSVGVVSEVVRRTTALGLAWEQVNALSDDTIEARLYGPRKPAGSHRVLPDPAYIHAERSRPHVTLELLHLEYLQQHPDGYRYSQFCEVYRRWVKAQGLSMRQIHIAGEKCFLDYSGSKPHVTDPKTGEVLDAELFVAVLGASNFTYSEATGTQQLADWIASNTRALEFFGGVPRAMVPDQLKSAVSLPCRYEPGIQRTFEDWGRHYGTAILPARPKHPKDKAKVESGVLVAQRWILARLRNQTFFSLDALNERIGELLTDLNDRPMTIYKESRRALFERLERSALQPLPNARYLFGVWETPKVNVDYHVEIDGHYYSVHHSLRHEAERVDARVTATTVEIFVRGERHVTHLRSFQRGRHTTVPEHMPKAHQKHLEWTPSRICSWARSVGEQTEVLVRAILADRPHPEQGYRSCLGILRLAKSYVNVRLEAACGRAFAGGARSYRHVAAILKNGLDAQPLPPTDDPAPRPPVVHENVRGPKYYTPDAT